MTTYEHAMLGANACLACGLHRKFGWRILAFAGLAAIAPDWDGLPVLWDTEMFDRGHRVWGHNVFSCLFVAILLTAAQLRWDYLGWMAGRLVSLGPFQPYAVNIGEQKAGKKTAIQLGLVCYLACLSQIPADAVVSGGRGLSDWELKPLWPVSDWSVVYSMVPWGKRRSHGYLRGFHAGDGKVHSVYSSDRSSLVVSCRQLHRGVGPVCSVAVNKRSRVIASRAVLRSLRTVLHYAECYYRSSTHAEHKDESAAWTNVDRAVSSHRYHRNHGGLTSASCTGGTRSRQTGAMQKQS